MSLSNFGRSLKYPTLWKPGCRQANKARKLHLTPETKQPRKTFGQVKPHFTDFQFHNKEEVEMALREWLHMQKICF
jgi:hypothetical protein